MRYKRVVIKLSGGALAGDHDFGFETKALNHIADEVLRLHSAGVEIAVVVGGGNIFRGRLSDEWHIERAEADNIGMMATVINCLMLRGVLESRGAAAVRVMTAIPINTVAEPFIRLRALRHLENHNIVILAGGSGNPYVTTDYASVLRALELQGKALLAAKHGTAGLYTDDPHRNPQARLYSRVSYETVVRRNLQALDQAAVIQARDHHLPVHLFDFEADGAMLRICNGEDIGTIITDGEDVLG
jgi:uridylate kinase